MTSARSSRSRRTSRSSSREASTPLRTWCGGPTTSRGEMTVCDIDLRPRGPWRFAMVTPDGVEVAFHGEYREVVPGERLVSTEVFEMPGAPPDAEGTLNTATFAELDGRTRLTVLVQCPSKDIRDAIIDSGMEGGMQEAMDRLEQVAASLA